MARKIAGKIRNDRPIHDQMAASFDRCMALALACGDRETLEWLLACAEKRGGLELLAEAAGGVS